MLLLLLITYFLLPWYKRSIVTVTTFQARGLHREDDTDHGFPSPQLERMSNCPLSPSWTLLKTHGFVFVYFKTPPEKIQNWHLGHVPRHNWALKWVQAQIQWGQKHVSKKITFSRYNYSPCSKYSGTLFYPQGNSVLDSTLYKLISPLLCVFKELYEVFLHLQPN